MRPHGQVGLGPRAEVEGVSGSLAQTTGKDTLGRGQQMLKPRESSEFGKAADRPGDQSDFQNE